MKFVFLISLIFTVAGFSACQNAAKDETISVQNESQTEIKQVSVTEAKPLVEKPDVQFIDVRTPEEYKGGHAPKAENFPLDKLENLIAKLDKEKPVYIICETGRRSQKGAEILKKNGFTDLTNIQGGTSGWIAAGFATEK